MTEPLAPATPPPSTAPDTGTANPDAATRRWRNLGLLAVGIAIVFVVPAMGLGAYGIYLWSLTLVYLLPAAGLNLMLGYAGQISLAQGAFVGVGAYTVAVIGTAWPLWLRIIVGTAAGFVLGVALGLPALRVRHHYLAMVTLAANQVFVLVVSNQKITGGGLGILHIARPPGASGDLGYHVVISIAAGVAMLLLYWVLAGPWGRAFKGIRENEQRAEAVGVSVRTYKLIAFAIGSALAALGGTLLAPLLHFVDPTSFSLTVSLNFLLIVVLGGRGRFEAAFLGTIVIILLPELFRVTQGLLPFLFALAMLLIVMFVPGGIAGVTDAIWLALRRLAGRAAPPRTDPPETPAGQPVPVGAAGTEVPSPTGGDEAPGLAAPDLTGPAVTADRPPPSGPAQAPAGAASASDPGPGAPSSTEPVAAPVAGPVLSSHGLEIRFGHTQILHGVDISVSRGEILGLIGPNGSGKSTWMNCVSGVLRPTAGRVLLDGRDVTGASPHRMYRRGLGRTFQLLENFPEMTVRENLILAGQERRGSVAGRLVRPSVARERARAAELAEFLGIARLLDEPIHTLSYGQQKLADIGMALMPAPDVLMLDEPMAGVNPTLVTEIARRLVELNAAGTTLVIIEHNMRVMMGLCHRMVVLGDGRVIAQGQPGEVRHDPAVISAYFGS